MEWHQKKLLSKWNYLRHYLLELKSLKTCRKNGSRNKWARLKIFGAGLTLKIMPTSEEIQKRITFYHNNDFDMLKLGCKLTNTANIYLQVSTAANFCRFTDGSKTLLEKIWEDVIGGPSIVLTRKAIFDKYFIRKSTNTSKSPVGIHDSQLCPYSTFQSLPTGLYTR